jgi:hypothetical protein
LHLQERGNSLLILDVEGLDSKERGSTGRHFEYNVAFFVAYTADIVILNVFSHDIGRQNAATFHALVTVLREKFKLVESSHKKDRTLLLVAIRDFDEVDAPIDDLKQALEDDFHALWPSVVQGSDIKMEELYDIQFYGLPSKLFETARFEEKVDHMRKSIMDRWLRTSGGLSSSSSFLMLFKELWTEISNRTSSPEPLCISATASLVELLIDLHCTRIIQYVMGGAREKVHRALSSILENFSDEISVASLALEIHDESILKYRWMARHYVHSPKKRSCMDCCGHSQMGILQISFGSTGLSSLKIDAGTLKQISPPFLEAQPTLSSKRSSYAENGPLRWQISCVRSRKSLIP